MNRYLDCLKTNGSTSSPCRVLGKDYLDCRMNRYARVKLDGERVTEDLQGTHGTRRLEKSWDGESGHVAERACKRYEGHWAAQ